MTPQANLIDSVLAALEVVWRFEIFSLEGQAIRIGTLVTALMPVQIVTESD